MSASSSVSNTLVTVVVLDHFRYFDGNIIKESPDAEQQRAYDAMSLSKSDLGSYEKV